MEAKSFINEFNFRKMMVILKAREETRMRDTFTLYAKAGDGGNGYSSFRRSRHDRHGKPDGKWSSHMPVILRQMWMQRAKSVWQLEPCRRSSKSPLTFSSFCSYSDEPQKKAKAAPFQETRMRDRFRLYAKAGDGGNGYSSFRRSRHDRHGEPDGGFPMIDLWHYSSFY